MKRPFFCYLAVTLCMPLIPSSWVQASETQITIEGNQRCLRSDGLPGHTTGRFPNSGNPNQISKQNIRYCFPLNPLKNTYPKKQGGSIGVALNGITIRPGTADYWDATSRRGHSRNASSGWNLEGLGSREVLGMDDNNAHVDNKGLYHYHGVADALVEATRNDGSLIGYAADGFEIHYVKNQLSSFRLKSGTRGSGPKGQYDGSYNEDWQYVDKSGTLDRCNGGQLNGKFVYFATVTYPFFPRCLWGSASHDFGMSQRSNDAQKNNQGSARFSNQGSRPNRQGPPRAALIACTQLTNRSACSFSARNREITGLCRQVPNGSLACVPNRAR